MRNMLFNVGLLLPLALMAEVGTFAQVRTPRPATTAEVAYGQDGSDDAERTKGMEPKTFSFVRGCDISGITADEARGRQYFNAAGEKREGTALMKELGMNTVRLRVWVHPWGKFSTIDDMTRLAQRACNLGMAVMVTLHYSDTWADPQHESTPKAWANVGYKALRDSVTRHTTEAMEALRNAGVYPTYVQIGNETRKGFLWPTGNLDSCMANYADLNNAGYEAVKALFPKTICIIHIDDGYNQPLYDRIFDGLKQYGGKYDMIGMSLYPYWAARKDSTLTGDIITRRCLANIEHLYKKYGKESMIVETGYDAQLPDEGYGFLSKLIRGSLASRHCRGVIYWAPEIEAGFGYKLGSFKDNRPTKALDAFKIE